MPFNQQDLEQLMAEEAFFDQQRMSWIASGHCGEWAVVRDRTLIDFFATEDEAYEMASMRFKRRPFLLKQVLVEEEVDAISPIVEMDG
jgi:hypothetical protein